MKKKLVQLISFLCLITIGVITPKYALAFECISNGVNIGGAGTYNIPVTATLTKTTSSIVLSDMSTYTTCTGDNGTFYQDAMKTTGATLSSKLTAIGFTGFADISGTKYNFPVAGQCIWPDSSCSVVNQLNSGQRNVPVKVKIGIQRLTGGRWDSMTIPAGTTIATFTITQRGQYAVIGLAWGNNKTWNFVLQNALVIPSYSCNWTNPNLTVILPPVAAKDIREHGKGTYTTVKPFKVDLTCDPQTTVTVQFDGTTMAGEDDVLANTEKGNDSIGVKILFNNSPIVFGTKLQVVANSLAQESLTFNAYYYYNGKAVQAGKISSIATLTLTYN